MPEGDANKNFRMGTWLVQPDLNRLSGGDHAVMLEPRVMAVLVCLARQPGRIVRADELLDTVWHGRAHSANTIYQSVADLRKALDDDVHDPRYIETIAKKGYRLICPVTPAAADSEMSESALHSPNGHRYRRRNIAIFAGVASIAVAIVLTINMELWDRVTNNGPRERSVAVLPFVDMSQDGSQQYLSDGISEELIHVLSNLADLRVTARTSSFAFRNTNEDIRQIGRKLNVATILEGSIRKDGDRIRVTSQLVDTSSGYHLWSQTFDRSTTDLFNIQNEIAIAVARAFDYRNLDAIATDGHARRPDELQSYDFYLLGLHQLRKNERSGALRAIRHFERAIEIDPSYARAFAGLSESYSTRYWIDRDQELLDKAESAAEYALILDDQSAEAFAALGFVKAAKHDFVGAVEAYRKAVALNPNDAHAFMYLAFNISHQGGEDEALVMVKKALELDPMSGRLNNWMGYHHIFDPRSDWDAAFRYFQRAMDGEPDFAWSYKAVGRHYQSIGELNQALPYFRKVVDLTTSPYEAGLNIELLVSTYVDIGDYTSAAKVIRRVKELEPDHIGATNSEIQLQLARGNVSTARDIVHKSLLANLDNYPQLRLLAYSEIVVGDTDHAEDIYKRLTEAQETSDIYGGVNLHRGNDLYSGNDALWGLHGAVNIAQLHKSKGDTRATQVFLDKARDFVESRSDQSWQVGNSLYTLAQIAAIEENNDAAIEYVRTAVEAGWAKAWFGRIDPIMSNLRKDARYSQILDKLEDKLLEMREHPKMLASN